jgi:azurin
VAPTAPGDYDYICSFPGHAALMKGVLRVEP